MQSRRDFMKTAAAASAGMMVPLRFGAKAAMAAAPPATPLLKKWIDPLISAIPVLSPIPNASYPGADYYEIFMGQGRWQFHSQLPVTAPAGTFTTWGYGQGAAFLGYLGPTIEAKQGVPVVVKYINNLPTTTHPLSAAIDPTVPDPMMYPGLLGGRATPHLHGGFTAPQYDGHPYSWWTVNGDKGANYASLPGQATNEAIFAYCNQQQAAQLWYHDHAMGITRLNVYAGLAGLYFVRDANDTGVAGTGLNLPKGQYEIPLVIQDKQFNADGSLFYPTVGITAVHPIWVPEFFGDTPVVNGKAYPFLNVEPRRYRFRIVNAAQARFFNMWIAGPGKSNLTMWVIGMEQSLLPAAVPLQKLLLAPGERADVIVDFTGIKPGTSFMLSNNANTPYPGGGKPAGPAMPDLMKINVVAAPVGGAPDTTTLPSLLVLPPVAALTATPGAPMREVAMKETFDPVTAMPTEVKLNERWFFEAVEEAPKVGNTEIWQFINLTVDAHPMHMHLVQFQVVNRQGLNAAAYTTAYLAWVAAGRNPATKPLLTNFLVGLPIAPAPEESGWKDTVKAYPGQVTRVIAKFDVPGLAGTIAGTGTTLPADYVYHCHILEHEENEMMRPFQVVA